VCGRVCGRVCACAGCRAGSEYVRSIVFGGMDGILTSVGIVASILGADLSAKVGPPAGQQPR
jgi:hypothetical protein